MVDSDRNRIARGATLYNKKKENDATTKKALSRVRQRIDKLKKEGNPLEYETALHDENYFPKILSFLTKHGIEVIQYKDKYVLRRVRVRMGRLKLTSYRDYLQHLEANPLEITELKESLSINVTRFYRNRDTFDLIRDQVFPDLLQAAHLAGRKEVSVWSAGCAVGAEPYTLAMTATSSIASQIRVRIHATDIKNELLSIARNGKYSDQYVAEMEEPEIYKFFHKISDSEYEVIPSIKRLVNFSQHDLMKDPYPANFDMIICRNVLIYVDREAQVEIVKKFMDSLRPGGVLCLGRTETLFGDWRSSMKIISTKHRIYQKIPQSGLVMKPVAPEVDRERKRVKKTSSIRDSKSEISRRTAELENFRKTYEERKKTWEERMAKYRSEREERAKTRTFSSSSTNNFRQSIRDKNKPDMGINPNRFAPGGSLSYLRSSLKKTKAEKDATVKDRKEVMDIKPTDTPEEIYRKLQAKKKAREKRFRN